MSTRKKPAVSGPLRVVVVEDNPGDVILIQEAFQAAGIEVHLAVFEDGEELLKAVSTALSGADGPRPDLVLMDLNQPRSYGTEVLDAVRARPHFADVPVAILSSAMALPANHARTLDRHARYYQKPLAVDDFFGLVRRIVDELVPGFRRPAP